MNDSYIHSKHDCDPSSPSVVLPSPTQPLSHIFPPPNPNPLNKCICFTKYMGSL